jgi:hypothetical protein
LTLTIDVFASKSWYVPHLAPVWAALGPDAGTFHVAPPAWTDGAARIRGATTAPLAGGDVPILTIGYPDMATARKAGRTRLALGQHGIGQSYLGALAPDQEPHPGYPGGDRQDEVGLFLVPNETAARVTREAYPAATVAVVGCPKLDALPARRPDGGSPVVAISTHWDARVSPESQSAWRHYRATLLRLGATHRVIGHGHPRELRRIAPLYRAAGIEVVPSFDAVIERASVYVCDNSSSMYEAAAAGLAVVVLNAPTYRREVEHGLRFWAAAGVGINVDRAAELEAAIARALELRPDDVAARERTLDVVYQPRHGAAELAAAALRAWADT